jgi:MFS family permease
VTVASQPLAASATAPHRNDWRVLLAVFVLAGVVESQAFGHLGAFTPLFLQQLHVPQAQIAPWTGILGTLGFVIGLPLLPFWGVWADRFGRKIIIVRTAYVEAVLFTLVSLSPNVWVLAVGRLLTGFVFGNTGVMLALLADVTPRKRLGLAIGIAGSAFPLGSAIGPFIGGMIAQGPGIRTLLLMDAIASGVIGVLLTLIIRAEPGWQPSRAKVGALIKSAARDIMASSRVVRLFGIYFLAMFAMSLATPFVPILLQRLYHGPSAQIAGMIGMTLAAAGCAMAVTTPLWGRLGDLAGRWRVLPICLGALVAGLVGEALAPSLVPLRAAIFGVGLFQGAVGTTIIALLAVLAPVERRASILNFAMLPSQLSWFLAPITGSGLLALAAWNQLDPVTALRGLFGMGAVVMGIACALAVSLAVADARQRRAQGLPGGDAAREAAAATH